MATRLDNAALGVVLHKKQNINRVDAMCNKYELEKMTEKHCFMLTKPSLSLPSLSQIPYPGKPIHLLTDMSNNLQKLFSWKSWALQAKKYTLGQRFSNQIDPRPVFFTTTVSRQKSSPFSLFITFLFPSKRPFQLINQSIIVLFHLFHIVLLTLTFCLDKTILYSLTVTIIC